MSAKNARTFISTGSGSTSETLEKLSQCYPFVRQECYSALMQPLQQCETKYFRGRTILAKVLDLTYSLSDKYSSSSGILLYTTECSGSNDAWCLDQRALLTLSLSKETYQQLGLVGVSESRKEKERFVVEIDLYDRTSKIFTRAKESFRLWDDRRRAQGLGEWDVICNITDRVDSTKLPFDAAPTLLEIKPLANVLHDIRAPDFAEKQLQRPLAKSSIEDDVEDWHNEIAELFEWVGMACLNSDRIRANDRVDPYISVYELPTPNTLSSVTHLRWIGLITPSFMRSILDTIFTPNESAKRTSFVAVTANMVSECPVSHVPFSAFAEGASQEARRKRSPKVVQCWSLLAVPRSEDVTWALGTVEST